MGINFCALSAAQEVRSTLKKQAKWDPAVFVGINICAFSAAQEARSTLENRQNRTWAGFVKQLRLQYVLVAISGFDSNNELLLLDQPSCLLKYIF